MNFDIFPHYEEHMLSTIKENYKGEKLYLLKNGEAILVEDKKITIIGEEKVVKK